MFQRSNVSRITHQAPRFNMPLFLTGINHQTAPVEVRERFSLEGEQLEAALLRLQDHVAEAVVLSTCNRLEVYTFTLVAEPGLRTIIFSSLFPELAREIEVCSYTHSGAEAARHLFNVASSLVSLVLGEVQVLGQTHRAWQAAHRVGMAGPVLSHLFHRAVTLGKRVHSETAVSRQPASVSYAAVALAREIFGTALGDRKVLVIGTGEVGEGVARCLHDHGVRATVVAHRQVERAESLARRYQATVATWDELPACLEATDIVITSTAAPHTILQKQQVAEAIRERGGRPLYLIDLAVPRDVDPAVGSLPGVRLHNIDDLQAVVRTTLEERRAVLPAIEAMVAAETSSFEDWVRARPAVPAIKHLRSRALELARQEAEWALAKMPGLSPDERRIVRAMADRLAGKLMHEPISSLKARALEDTDSDYGATPGELHALFYAEDTGEALEE
jgi:glutamyl-tRNA reductase